MNINQPLFSILIANYNNGQYLVEAIESVIKQTYEEWEIIIVDDKSTDDSLHIYERFATHAKIKVYYNERNCGCGFTKSRCVEVAEGELCAFLDPDDVLHPKALEEMVLAHSSLKGCSLVYSTHFACNELLHPIESTFNSSAIASNESHLTSSVGNISHFACFKRESYLQTTGIDPILKRAVDQDLYYKLEEHGKIYFIDKPLYYYRHHGKSISLNKNNLKAQYWNLIASTNAFKRRLAITTVPNLTKQEIEKKWLAYLLKKAIYHSKEENWLKMYSYLFQAGRYIKYDKNLSVLRIGLAPFK